MKSKHIKLSVGSISALLAVTVGISAFLLIRHSDEPLDSLQSYQPAHDYGESFWIKEYNNNTSLWNKAINYCDIHGTPTPGCIEVEDTRAGIDVRTLAKYEKIRY